MRFAEELMLLLLDDDQGQMPPNFSTHSLNTVLAGSVLMDLALEGRIDTALERFIFVDGTLLGDTLLDPVLAEISQDPQDRETAYWIKRIADERGDDIRRTALARLTAQGIVEASDSRRSFFLSKRVSRTRRYLTVDGRMEEDIRLRIMRVLFSDDIPDPREIAIISLADACGIFATILSSSELAEARDRIDLVRQLDAIGRSVTQAVEALRVPDPVRAPSISPEIPGDSGLPIFGHALQMTGDMRGLLLKEFRKHGPIFRLRAFQHSIVVLAGPEAAAFVARDNRCLRSHDIWQDFHAALGARHSPLSADGSQHVRMRRDHAPYFSRRLLARPDAMATAIKIARSDIANWPKGKPLEVKPAFQRMVAEQIGVLCTGMSSREYFDDVNRFLSTLLSTHVARRVPKLVTRMPRFRRARRRVRELVRKIVEGHSLERRQGVPSDLVDILLEHNRADPHYMPEADFLIFVLGPLIAGLDTAANVLAFMTYEVSKRPDLVERVRAEADAFFENGTPTLKDVENLDVIHRATMETMRLHPLTPVLPRTAANSFRFKGHEVAVGEPVLIAHTVPHMMPEYYPEPERFDIERYGPERAEHRQPRAYLPFGVGPHQCLGRTLAEALMAVDVACVMRDADIVLHPPNYKLRTVAQPSLSPHKSLRMRVVARRHTRD